MNIPCLFSFLTRMSNSFLKKKIGVLLGSTLRKGLQIQICNSSPSIARCHIGASLRTWPTKLFCGQNWNMLLLFGTHSLRLTSVDWKLHKGGRLDLSATATVRPQV